MTALAIGGLVFVAVFGAALLGTYVRARLPDHHLSADARTIVTLGMGLIGTMSALVLSLLISSAKTGHDTRAAELTQVSADVVLLDRVLAYYGPETTDARALLRDAVAQAIDRLWPPDERSQATPLIAQSNRLDVLYGKIHALTPENDTQRSLHTQALALTMTLARTRLMLLEQSGSSIPAAFLVVLVLWLSVILVNFGLFAPPKNATVIAALFVCALAFSSAIFLILELDEPFKGFSQISSAPLRSALAQLGR